MFKFNLQNLFFFVLTVLLAGCVQTPEVKVFLSKKTKELNKNFVLDSITNQTAVTTFAITTIDANDGGDDISSFGNVLTYTCFYDSVVDGVVDPVTSCTSLAGVSFNSSSGIMDWTPATAQVGNYEFSITGTDGTLFDDELFSITVTRYNLAPVLDAIADEVVNEGVAITTVNAGEAGADLDADGDAITYSCYYDTSINGVVASTSACSGLSGINFTAATGVLNWMPDLSQSGTYEFKILGSDGSLSDDEIFSITVNNVNQAPVLDGISDETVSEGVAITTVDAGDGADDLDSDGQTLAYACYYDTTINGAVASTTSCTALTGISFSTTTGVMNWLPLLNQAGDYEFKIIASDGSLTDDDIFSIVVNNVNQAPVLAAISNQALNENVAITSINANDGGDDLDADGSAITYTCYYDTTVDAAVAATSACSGLTGITFTGATGVMDWTPSYSQSGAYEFIITGSDGSLTDSKIFTVTVSNVNRAPSIDAISNQTVVGNSAITTIDVGDGGDDLDVDGDTITYSCYYDTVINASVAITNSCSSLTGVTFSSTTGVMDWTPTLGQAGAYEFRVVAQDAGLSTGRIFTITVTTPTPFVSLWRTTVANRVVVLPVGIGGTYNFLVDYGDGSPIAAVTSDTDPDNTHTYVAAGDYTVTITGQMSLVTFENNAAARAALIKVINLGDTGATNLSNAFRSCANLTDFAGGNTSKVTNMSNMFFGAIKLVNADFSTFDTSKVTDMSSMFQGTTLLNTLDLSSFNTAAVTNMALMFYGKINLTTLDLSSFNTANVTDMSYMFYNNALATNYTLTSFNTAKVTTMYNMFYNNAALTSLDLSSFRTPEVTSMANMFQKTTNLVSLDLSAFNTAKVTTMESMFAESGITSLDVSNFDTLQVTNMSKMFLSAIKITSLDLSSFVTTNVVNMSQMFGTTTKLATLDIQNFDTAKVTDMNSMFYSAVELTTLDLSHFDTGLVTNMSSMFRTTSKLTSLDISSFNTSNVTLMTNMFTGTRLPSINLSNFDTIKVTSMTGMFQNATSLTSLDLTDFETDNVLTMNSMFQSCAFTSIDVSMFVTTKVTDMSFMFYNSSVTNLNLSSFTTNAVTNMASMFHFARFTTLNISNFNTSAVTNMSSMFLSTSSIATLNLSHFNTSNVTNMTNMFQSSFALTSLNTTGWDLTKASTSTGVFTSANAGLVVTCNQGGSPATGTFFGKTCN